MRMSILSYLIIIAGVVVLGDAAGNAASLGSRTMPIPQAPIGHLQPRVPDLSVRSAAEQDQQRAMSDFDAEQRKLDEELDKKLNICRW